jgi:phosphoglucomutase
MLTPSSIEDSLSRMILSASGWRTVFAADSNEHSTTDRVDQVHLAIAVLAAQAYSDYLLKRCGSQPVVLVGTDTRPTGPAIARAAIRGLLDRDITPTFLSVSAAPEIAAFAGSLSTDTTPAGFCYISASHNPLGHNGLKLGDPGGAVLGGAESQKLISRFRDMCGDSEAVARAEALL